MPPFDPSQYFEGPFTAGGYYPTNQVSMTEADVRGKAQAEAIGAGQQKAIDMEKEVQRKAAEELNKQRMQRFNMLTDLYRRPTQFDPSLGEEEIQKRANARGISLNEARNIAYNEQAQAEGRASDLINKTNAWKQENQPLPTYSLGKDYFGRDITTNRPAATAQEQAQRIEAYNQTPGSLTQYALSPEEKKIELAHISNLQDMNKANMLNQQRSQAATNGWAWNSSAGRYTRTNELTSGQQAAMRERLKLSPSFIFQPGKATETPAIATPPVVTPVPATVTPEPAPVAKTEPAMTTPVKTEVAKVVEQPVAPVQTPSAPVQTPSAPVVAQKPPRDIPQIERDKILMSAGINPNAPNPVATKGAGRKGYTVADKQKADRAEKQKDFDQEMQNFKTLRSTKSGRAGTINTLALTKSAEKLVALSRDLGIPAPMFGDNQSMYAGTEKLGGQ
jgi:hypothetical protein